MDSDFGEFAAARSAALFRTALLLTGDRHAADDLVQTALEKACRKWGRVRQADSPDAYVRRILVNLVADRGRRAARLKEVTLTGDHADGRDPFLHTELRDQLIRALWTLPVGMRTVLVLRYYDDMTDPDIAEVMGVSTATVRSQAARALAKLRADAGWNRGDAEGTRFGGAAS